MPDAEFVRKYDKAVRSGNWKSLDWVELFCPFCGFLPISSMAISGRVYVTLRPKFRAAMMKAIDNGAEIYGWKHRPGTVRKHRAGPR